MHAIMQCANVLRMLSDCFKLRLRVLRMRLQLFAVGRETVEQAKRALVESNMHKWVSDKTGSRGAETAPRIWCRTVLHGSSTPEAFGISFFWSFARWVWFFYMFCMFRTLWNNGSSSQALNWIRVFRPIRLAYLQITCLKRELTVNATSNFRMCSNF